MIGARHGAFASDESDARMPTNIPNQIQVARQSIEAAQAALESSFEHLRVMPRAEKVMVSDKVHEACLRLQAAKDLLAQLETILTSQDGA
jgi:hypothetical protein